MYSNQEWQWKKTCTDHQSKLHAWTKKSQMYINQTYAVAKKEVQTYEEHVLKGDASK